MSERVTTDPADELFDVLDDAGNVTGVVKRRADVHRDGDWHRAFHLWLFAGMDDGSVAVLFQRRSAGKDTWPNRLDVAVGGHYRTGETLSDVVREIEEEIGIESEMSSLVYAGQRRSISKNAEWHDREVQEVYMLTFRRHLPDFHPNLAELAGLVQIDVTDLQELFNGRRSEIQVLAAPVVAPRTLGKWELKTVAIDDFVPVRDDYVLRASLAGQALIDGATSVSIE